MAAERDRVPWAEAQAGAHSGRGQRGVSDNVISHPTAWARTDLTPEQALQGAAQYDWETVVIVGFTNDSEGLVVRSSEMTRKDALWIAEHFRLYALDRL